MDFSVEGSESWESTPSQEIFIKSYFKKREPQRTGPENKISKKRKRRVLNSETTTSTTGIDRKKKISKIELSLTHAGGKATNNKAKNTLYTNRVDVLEESKFCNSAQNDIETDVDSDPKNRSLKSNDKTISHKLDLKGRNKLKGGISNKDNSSPSKCIQGQINVAEIKIALKTKKSKHRPVKKSLNTDKNGFESDVDMLEEEVVDSQVNCTPVKQTATKIKTKGNKVLQKKKDLNSNDRSTIKLNPADVSEDSDEELIRNELQNTPIFQKLQRLMKKAPHLDPNFDRSKGTPSMETFSDESMSEDRDDISNISDSSSVEDNAEDSPSGTNKNKPPRSSNNQHNVIKASSTSSSSMKASSDSIASNSSSETDNVSSSGEEDAVSLQTSKEDSKTRTNQRTLIDTSNRENKSDPSVIRSILKAKVSSTLKSKAQEKLASAKFRYLNEKLYTETGRDAFKYFQENTDEFGDYHLGYSLQVSKWPLNPVNEIIAQLQKIKKSIVIADLGCGDAKIAQVLTSKVVHSFDLVAINEFVTACDISKIPLANGSVDVAVFCLSLMGVNLKDYLCEAYRILKLGGSLKIAEVESRIEDLDFFIKSLTTLGFALERKNTKHKLFVFLDFKKEKRRPKIAKVSTITLRPCLYKKR